MPMIISILIPQQPVPKLVLCFWPMLDYFKFEMIVENEDSLEENLDKGKNYIFAAQPHGVISMCGMCSAILDHKKYMGIRTAVASALLKIPILKHVLGIFGLTDASAKNLRKILKREGRDGSVVIYVGGMAELFMSSREEERLYLSKRKGFVKMALREGVDIVPVYLFGNTSVLSVLQHGPLAKLSRKLQLSFTFFWGKWLLPIPRDDKLLYAAGVPIEIPKIAEPTQEDVDKYHALYIEEVKRLFEGYKSKAGHLYEKKTLIIE